MWLLVRGTGEGRGRGVLVPLRDGRTVVGRAESCDVVLADSRASREHVALERHGASVTFLDLSSRSGTTLNGGRRAEGEVGLGDEVGVGGTLLRLVADPAALGDAPEAPAVATGGAAREDWRPFKALVERLQQAAEPARLLEALLDGMIDLLGAERGFVLLTEGATPVTVARRCPSPGVDLVAVSATVTTRALALGGTVLVADTAQDPWYRSASAGTVLDRPRSIVCTPLLVGDAPAGVVYLDAPSEQRRLDPSRVALLEASAALAAELLAAERTRRACGVAGERLSRLSALALGDEPLVLGPSTASRSLAELLERAAAQDVTVLLTGETGTGKEMVARELHLRSARRAAPFVALNAAELPAALLEAELFGVARGAFTGASEPRMGRFELAHGGTLFLDEVGELPPDAQVKLLRVLQERRVSRLGSTDEVAVDVRVVAATNRDPTEAVRCGALRQDFFYRLNVFPVRLAPLRERPEDVVPLAEHFLARLAARGARALAFSAGARARLLAHPWPGNVRELRNAVERAAIVARGATVETGDLPPLDAAAASAGAAFWDGLPAEYPRALEAFEREYLARSLRRHGGNVTAVAREYGMHRNAIYRRLARLGLAPDEGGEGS